MNCVKVTGIRCYGHHGCLPSETLVGQEYVVNVWLYTDFAKAAKTDNLQKTIDYVTVNQIVTEEVKKPSKLIEAVGYRIISRLKNEFDSVEKITVEVIKPNPPINGDVQSVSIIIEE
ncbi:MAG: dihydroneopterin aldolase [Flavobacteriales bacterium]